MRVKELNERVKELNERVKELNEGARVKLHAEISRET